MQLGTESEGEEALRIHRLTWSSADLLPEGSGWSRALGATRAVYRRRDASVVYKVETCHFGGNHQENRSSQTLVRLGFLWAPETSLYSFDGQDGNVLAMAFYPFEVESLDEVPSVALQVVADHLKSNFRRTELMPAGIVKVIDLADYTPQLDSLIRAKAQELGRRDLMI